MNPKTIAEWQSYLEGRYNTLFDRSAVELVKTAAERSTPPQAGDQIATNKLIKPLSTPQRPFVGINLRSQTGATLYQGDPPWHEHICDRDLNNGYATQHGFTAFSFDLEVCLTTASQLTKVTGQFRSVNVWHIAFALVSLSPPAFSHDISKSGKPLAEVIKLLRSNAKKFEQGMFRVLPWRTISEDNEPPDNIYRLAVEDGQTLSDIFSRLNIKPSYAVNRAFECSLAQVTQVASIIGYAEVGVEHVLAGLLAAGLEDDGMEHAAISLPLKMVTALDFTEDQASALWNYLRSKAVQDRAERGWKFSDVLTSVLVESKNLKDLCTPNDDRVAARHLLAAILARVLKDITLRKALEQAKLDLEKLATALRDHLKAYEEVDYPDVWGATTEQSSGSPLSEPVYITGTLFRAQREADDSELCLNIKVYAEAIANTFTAADDEDDFVFALYGPWGRGKSTLIAQVVKLLAERKTAKNIKAYETVMFSAWKYPTRPEVWAYLYQRLVTAAKEGGFWQSLRISLRVGLLKNGWWPLLLGFGLLAISRLQLDFVHWVFDGLGIIGLLVLGSFAWNTTKSGKRIAKSYFVMPDHGEKLGLQAVVGEDVKHLLQAWTQRNPDSNKDPKKATAACDFTCFWPAWWAAAAVVVFIWTALGLVAWKIHNHLPNHGKGKLAESAVSELQANPMPTSVIAAITPVLTVPPKHMRIEVNAEWQGAKLYWAGTTIEKRNAEPEAESVDHTTHSYVLILDVLFVLSAIAALLLVITVCKLPRQCKRVLLIVDDLDRCEPGQMLAVIESLRMFLDEPEMSHRLQIAMLVDRNILKAAMLSRAETQKLIITPNSHDSFVRQQEEKFFVVSMALPPLDLELLKNLANLVVKREVEQQLAVQNNPDEDTSQPEKKLNSKSTILPTTGPETSEAYRSSVSGTESSPKSTEQISHQDLSDVHFSKDEQAFLVEVLNELEVSNITPRAYRSFVLRYQLARLILRGFNTSFNSKQVINELANRLFTRTNDDGLPILPADVLTAIHSVVGHER